MLQRPILLKGDYLKKASVCFLLIVLAAIAYSAFFTIIVSADGKMIYVDKNLTSDCLGNNYSIAGRDCSGTDGMAFDTIQEGVNNATAGDTVYIIGSTNSSSEDAIYNVTGNGITTVRVGLPEQRITIRSYPGHTVIIQGDGGDVGVYLDYANYTTFKGLIFQNFNQATESWAYKTDTVIENCEFTHTHQTGLRLRNVHNFIMRDSYVHQCFETGISVRDCDNVTFERVESSYNDDGQGADGDGDGFATSTCGTVNFYNCTARGNSEDGFDLTSNSTLVNCISSGHTACNVKLWRRVADNYAPKNYTIINSMFYGAEQAGIKVSAGAEMHLYNSVIYGNGEEGIAFRAFNISGWPLQVYSTIKNSIIAKNGYEGIGIDQYLGNGYANSTNNVSADYNIFYNNSAANNGLSSNTHNISANPLFFAPVVSEFHLRTGSPAIDNGTSLAGVVDYDFDGLSRPQDGDNNGSSEWDIGVHESYSPPGNQRPNFTYTGNTSFEVSEGVQLSIQLNATDADNDSLRYIIFDGNIVSELIVNNSGFFSFTPNFDRSNSTSNNTYNITIAVTDEHYYYPPDQINVSIKVINVNRAPIYSGLSRYTLIEGRKFRIKIPMYDEDGDVFTGNLYDLTQNSVYDNLTRIITWISNSSEIGNHVFNLNISDGMNSSNYSINFEVLNLTPYQQPSQQNIFYVYGANGNNSNTGNSTDNAWKTIQKAKDTLTAGQMVLIRGGDYYEYGAVAYSGNTTLPIIFKAYPGEMVVMHGKYPNGTSVKSDSSPEGFDFSVGRSNIVVDGLHFVNFSETLYHRGSNENITLLNLVIQDADRGIYGGANNLRIENTRITNVADRAIQPDNDNIHIYNVTINNASDRGISLYSDSYDNINIIKANISDCGAYGILVAGKNVFLSELLVDNNFLIGADIWASYAYIQNSIFSRTKISSGNAYNLLFGTSTEFELLNSVVFNSSQYGLYIRGTGNHSIKNCIIYNNNSNELRKPTGLTLNEDYNIFGTYTPVGSHSFKANPLFVDASGGNFRLKTGSSGIDNGTNTSIYTDIEGNSRPQDGDNNGSSEWDMGAYEYIQIVPTTPAPSINSNLLENTTIEDLNCSATILDLNGDSLDVSVRWYKNNILNLTFDYNNSYASGSLFVSSLSFGNLSVSDNWRCSVRLFDGLGYSSWGNSTNLTILPQDLTAPNITLIFPSDSYSTTSTLITFSYNVTDSSNIANCSLIINSIIDSTNSSITRNTNQNFTKTLSVGSYTWSVNCTDVFNNQGNSATRSITLSASGSEDKKGGTPSTGPSSPSGSCTSGQTKPCGIAIGRCKAGTQTCTNGQWSECTGSIGSTAEACNGIDDDCNGKIDDGIACDCIIGQTKVCGLQTGACRPGYRMCTQGKWASECIDETGPTAEVCGNGIDDDCDGTADESECIIAASINCTDGLITTPCICQGSTYASGYCYNGYHFETQQISDFPWQVLSFIGGGILSAFLLFVVVREVRHFGRIHGQIRPEEQKKARLEIKPAKKGKLNSVSDIASTPDDFIGKEIKIAGYVRLSSKVSDNEFWYSLYDQSSTIALKSAKELKEGYAELDVIVRKTPLGYVYCEAV